MAEPREQPIPSLDETGPRKGKAHAKRMVAIVRNYVARCRSLNKPRERTPSEYLALEQERSAVLSNLRRFGVHNDWLTHDGAIPEWLKLVDGSQKITAAVVTEQGGIPERSYVERLDNARQAFLEGAIFAVPPNNEENDQLIRELRAKYETAQFKRNLAKAVIKKFREYF